MSRYFVNATEAAALRLHPEVRDVLAAPARHAAEASAFDPAKIRSLGFDWPGSKTVEEYEVTTAQGVDLDATLRSLEQGLSFYDGQLREMRGYAGRWNAEVTGPQGDHAAKAADLRRGIATVKQLLAKTSS